MLIPEFLFFPKTFGKKLERTAMKYERKERRKVREEQDIENMKEKDERSNGVIE